MYWVNIYHHLKLNTFYYIMSVSFVYIIEPICKK